MHVGRAATTLLLAIALVLLTVAPAGAHPTAVRQVQPDTLQATLRSVAQPAGQSAAQQPVSPAGQPTGRPITLGATRTSDHFVVRSASASTAEQTLTLAEHAWDLLAPHFEFLPSEPVTIVVVEDTAEYERIQPAAMTRGFATFGGDHIYLRGADLDQEVVTHELVHILLGKNIRRGLAVPDWFNEGFAQFMSGADSHRREVFYLAASGRLLPLPELDRLDALRGPDRELPTIQGLAVVGFLVDEYGRDRLWDLVSRLSHARTFSQALLDTYGRSDLELSHEWQAYADTEYGLLSVVGLETLGTAMLGLLSLLAAVVWFATRIRLRARPASPLDLSPWEIESAERAAAMLDTGGGAGDAQGARGEDSGDRRTT